MFFSFDPKQLLEIVYVVTGLTLLVFAIMTFGDKKNPRRFGSGSFWLILAIIFVLGSLLPHWVTGLLVLVMAGLDGAGRVTKGDYNELPKSKLLEHARRERPARNREGVGCSPFRADCIPGGEPRATPLRHADAINRTERDPARTVP